MTSWPRRRARPSIGLQHSSPSPSAWNSGGTAAAGEKPCPPRPQRPRSGNPLVLDGEAIEGAASDPAAIGKLMVDQVWAEGADPTRGALDCERSSNEHRRLQAFEIGYEELMTGGWVRALVAPEQLERGRAGMEQATKQGLVSQHGTHRGVLLVELSNVPWG